MDWDRLVRTVMEEGRRHAGSGPELARRLEQVGVGPEGGRYSESGISNWIKGRAMPPADVLLATASIGRISLDARLLGDVDQPSRAVATDDRTERDELAAQVQDLARQYGRLEALLIDLYARTGQQFPHERLRPAAQDTTQQQAVGS